MLNHLLEFEKYDPRLEYKTDTRRDISLDDIRKSGAYRNIIDLGFEEEHSHQQELNNTLKFVRIKHKQRERGHSDVFYTVHPSGIVRRYNPEKSHEIPEGGGNDIRRFPRPFKTLKDYNRALQYLFNYLRRKELRNDYR